MSSKSFALLAIRLLIGGLFLATAALKVWSPAESAALSVAYNIPPPLTAVVIQVELFLASLLLFGCWTRQTLTASAILFGFFGAFSVYRGMAGHESCGCFGSLKVNPWITAVLDGTMLIVATWGAWKLAPPRERIQPWRLYGAGGCYAIAAIIGAAGLMAQAPTMLIQAEDMHAEAGGLIILEPEKWIGQTFPLTEHLTPAIDLAHGRWILLFYHHDCPHCQEALPQYERLAAAGNADRIVLIETPPFGAAPRLSKESFARVSRTRMSGLCKPLSKSESRKGPSSALRSNCPLLRRQRSRFSPNSQAARETSSRASWPSVAFTASTYRRVPERQRAKTL